MHQNNKTLETTLQNTFISQNMYKNLWENNTI